MEDKIIIIGGGTGGLAMALFLNRAGIKSEIYEKASEFKNVGASYGLHRNGVHVMQTLGLEKQLKENSHELSRYVFKDTSGEIVLDSETLDIDSSIFDDMIYISRHHMIDILYQEVQRQGIEVHFSKELSSLEQDESSVTAFFTDDSEATGSLLIGADGTNSKTRPLIFPYEPLRYNGIWAVFGMGVSGEIGDAEKFLEHDYIAGYFKDDFNMTISKHHPTDGERLSWIFIQNQDRKVPKKYFEEKPEDAFRKELAEKFNDFKEPIKELILKSSTFSPQHVFNVGMLPTFSFGRVALIGDALQTTDPYSGMGTTLSLEDGMYLARMLRDHSDYEDAFYYYEYDRKDIVRQVHKETERMKNLGLDDYEPFLKGEYSDKEDPMDNFMADMTKVYWEEYE